MSFQLGLENGMAPKQKNGAAAQSEATTHSVAAGVFNEFCETIAADKTLPGIGDRLKKTLIEDRDFSEAALRQALFRDAGS